MLFRLADGRVAAHSLGILLPETREGPFPPLPRHTTNREDSPMPNRTLAAFTALATVASPVLAAPHRPELRDVPTPVTMAQPASLLGDGSPPATQHERPVRDAPTLRPFAENRHGR